MIVTPSQEIRTSKPQRLIYHLVEAFTPGQIKQAELWFAKLDRPDYAKLEIDGVVLNPQNPAKSQYIHQITTKIKNFTIQTRLLQPHDRLRQSDPTLGVEEYRLLFGLNYSLLCNSSVSVIRGSNQAFDEFKQIIRDIHSFVESQTSLVIQGAAFTFDITAAIIKNFQQKAIITL